MEVCVTACSISRSTLEQLQRRPRPALRVLAVFERACDLVTSDDLHPRSVIALVTREIGNGPLNIVLPEGRWDLTTIGPGTLAQVDQERLQIGGLRIDLSHADVWEACPDWSALRTRRAAIQARLPALRDLGLTHAQAGSFLALLRQGSSENPPRPSVLAATRSACRALEAGWTGDRACLRKAAAQLAGLGGGLTPSGDDFLCGIILWAWLAHSSSSAFCRTIAATAAPRTTTLSAAFLRAAAGGECSAAWHGLLDALAHGDDIALARATQGVLMLGATSGADALAGFIWAGTEIGFGQPLCPGSADWGQLPRAPAAAARRSKALKRRHDSTARPSTNG